jgi:serine/threonine-protein kinase
LHGTESLRSSSETPTATLDESDSETYLQARALLSAYILRSRHAADLEHAKAELKQVLSRAPSFAPAHAALGIARLQFVRNGLADVETLKAAAAAFERALELDPHLVEAKLFRVYTLLALGEKESARHAVHHLLEVEPDSFDVHLVAAMLLRLDGMFEAALSHLAIALRLNPNNAPIIYNARARILHYRGQVDAAVQETQKGLELDPKNPMLRTTLGYLQLRLQDNHSALATLQSVLADEPSLQVARVTLAQCYLALARVRDAEAQLSDSLMAAAHCDPEIAYRIASYHAKRCDTINALTWLRRAIYVGNENFPWFRVNPAWDRVAEHPDFQAILDSLELRYRRNAKLWRQLLGHDFH